MAWVDIQKRGTKQIHKVTEEAYNTVFKEQGFVIINNPENETSTAENKAVRGNNQPNTETQSKRQYTRRENASNN